MSAIVISSPEKFADIFRNLEKIGIKSVHFYDSLERNDHTTMIAALMPFMELIVLEKEIRSTPLMTKVIEEAVSRKVPVIMEDAFDDLYEAFSWNSQRNSGV